MKANYFLLNKMQHAAFVLILVATLIVSTSALAAGGTLDPTFGTNGVVVTDLGGSSDTGINIVLQPDGKIIMVGTTNYPSFGTSIITRYNPNGTLDTTFGASGKLTADIRGSRVVLQTDGKLIVGGSLHGDFGLARYTNNGTLDTTFGTNGVATAGVDNDNFSISFRDLAIQPDGKIVVVGTMETTGNQSFYIIARFNENGVLDEDFRVKILDNSEFPGGMISECEAVALQSDGRIILSGDMIPYDGEDSITLARFATGPDPWLDPTFGTNGHGTVVTPLANFRHGWGALAIQADDKIVIAGTVTESYSNLNENLVLARYTSNGALDITLAGSGIVITDLGQNEVGNDLAIQSDGKILVAGKSYNETSSDFLLVRYNSNGSLDTSFGDAGKVISDFGGSADAAWGMALQPDGKILAAGAKDGDAVLARYGGTPSPTTTTTFKSKAPHDGWILESLEFSNVGGLLEKTATTFNVGDDQRDRQYRSIISFNTDSLPDNAIITSAQVKIKRQGLVGTDPFTTHGNLLLEIRNGLFSNDLDLSLSDFAAPASSTVQEMFTPLTSSWYAANLSGSNLVLVNKYGVTQFRLRFDLDDNDDLNSDYLKFFSGNATYEADHPQLIVTYVLP
ncbi:MAG: hypothetical protein EHM33_19275 [Chloroflexi bacterium]|nr:MAG: hypothetical protein EHM33_19275 [Chloroflexota bacterium]